MTKQINHSIETFLNLNYPCSCESSDNECPKESHESAEMTRFIKEMIDEALEGVDDQDIRARLDELFGQPTS